MIYQLFEECYQLLGEQGWRSGESTRFPPMWPGFDSRPSVICGLSLLLVLVPAPRVFSGFSGFPPSTKTNTFKFQFDQEFEDHRFVSRKIVTCIAYCNKEQTFLITFSSNLCHCDIAGTKTTTFHSSTIYFNIFIS